MASSPPTAAIEPEAALETQEIDVIVPEDAELGLAKTSAEFGGQEAEVRKPARIRDVVSDAEKALLEILQPIGFARRYSSSFS